MSDDYEVDTAVPGIDNRLYPRVYKSSKKDSNVLITNNGPNPVYVWPYRDKHPINRLLLRSHESHIFKESLFFKQIYYQLETPGSDTLINVEVRYHDKKS